MRPDEAGIGSGAGLTREVPVCLKALRAGGPADQRRGRQGSAPFEVKQLGAQRDGQRLDLALEVVGGPRQLADAAQLVARYPGTRRLIEAAQAPIDAVKPHHAVQATGG